MNELFLCTPGSIGSIVCLRQSPTMGALPPTPRSFPHWANGLFAKSVAARGKPCRNTEVSAPLATSTAPVALRQSRILRTMPDSYLKSPQHQSLRAQSCRNPVLLRLRCLVLNRLCLVLLRPRQVTYGLVFLWRSNFLVPEGFLDASCVVWVTFCERDFSFWGFYCRFWVANCVARVGGA